MENTNSARNPTAACSIQYSKRRSGSKNIPGSEPLQNWQDKTWCIALEICLRSPFTLNYIPFSCKNIHLDFNTIIPFFPISLKIIVVNTTFFSFHLVKVWPQLGKSTDGDQNLVSSDRSQDTWACQIADHSFYAFPHKMPRNPKFDQFCKVKSVPKRK